MLDPHTEDLLNLYVDGELPLDVQGELFSRLADDREARAQFSALMAFRLATRVDANPVAPAIDEALFARIDELRAHQHTARAEDRQPFRALRRRVTVGAALAVAGLVFVVQMLWPAPVETGAAPVVVPPVETASTVYVVWPGVTVEEDTLGAQEHD